MRSSNSSTSSLISSRSFILSPPFRLTVHGSYIATSRRRLLVARIRRRNVVWVALAGCVCRVAGGELSWRKIRTRRGNPCFQLLDLQSDLFMLFHHISPPSL